MPRQRTGSLFKHHRGNKDDWRCRITIGYGPTARRVSFSLGTDDEAEARSKLAEMVAANPPPPHAVTAPTIDPKAAQLDRIVRLLLPELDFDDATELLNSWHSLPQRPVVCPFDVAAASAADHHRRYLEDARELFDRITAAPGIDTAELLAGRLLQNALCWLEIALLIEYEADGWWPRAEPAVAAAE